MLIAAAACKRAEQPGAGYGDGTKTDKPAPSAATTTAASAVTAMPAYTAENLDGSKFDLAAKREKVVLLNVWATWCGPCREEIPELQILHERYGTRGFEVIGASVDESGADSVKEFIAKQPKMTYPVILDPQGNIANILQTSVLPTSILVDRKHNIVWKKVGAIERGDLEVEKAIEAAL